MKTLMLIATTLTVLTFGTGCKSLSGTNMEPDVSRDGQLTSIMDEFLEDAALNGRPVSEYKQGGLRVISFVDDIGAKKKHYGLAAGDDGDTVGTCASLHQSNSLNAGIKIKMSETSWREIWIHTSFADRSTNDPQLRELVYHELGHCLLDLEHVPDSPHQIMSPDISNDGPWLRQNWPTLLGTLYKH